MAASLPETASGNSRLPGSTTPVGELIVREAGRLAFERPSRACRRSAACAAVALPPN
ncbi:hypothetical protein AB0G67_29175 [Streptomyces sp. NPDC021056]|uniref:hypothetical protein n=1 Tax=Streptomyces sp. NPDC021056 TaxID=3155012 RepID=UPI0033C9CA85